MVEFHYYSLVSCPASVDSTARLKIHYISQSIITTPRSSVHVVNAVKILKNLFDSDCDFDSLRKLTVDSCS